MVRIITDSAADFEPQELCDMQITCVPMRIFFGEAEYRENVDITKKEFYDLLAEGAAFPKTSQPAPADFEEVLRPIAEAGEEAVVITVSSGLSGTCQSALLAKNLTEFDNCFIVDSLQVTGGQRILVEQAVSMRDSGKTASEIAETLEQLKARLCLFAYIDTLEYLYKGGRLSTAGYAIGSLANVKPLIEISDEGTVQVMAKTLSLRKGLQQLCSKLSVFEPDLAYPFYIVYTHNRANAELLEEQLIKGGYHLPSIRLVPVGATIGSHAGAGACGLVYVKK